jgi:hypothetical protein
MSNSCPELLVGRPLQDRVLQLVDLVVQIGQHREVAVDQRVHDEVEQHHMVRPRLGELLQPRGEGSQLRARIAVDGDQVVLGVKAVHLDQPAATGRPVDHHQRDVVIGVDLGPLPEVLGVLDRQRMEPKVSRSSPSAVLLSTPARSSQKRAEVSSKRRTVPVLTSCSEPSTVIRKLSMTAIVTARPAQSSPPGDGQR